MKYGWFYQPEGLHVYQVIKNMLLIIILNSLNQTTEWKKVVSTPPFAWHLLLFIVCNFANMLIFASIYHHTTITHASVCLFPIYDLWETQNTRFKSHGECLIQTADFFVNVPSDLQSDTGVHQANFCCKGILCCLSQTTAGNSEQALLEVVFVKCFKCKMWLWRVSLGQRGGCSVEVKCGSAKYLGLLEPDMHWNSHTMFLHLFELII